MPDIHPDIRTSAADRAHSAVPPATAALAELYERFAELDLQPLWTQTSELLPPHPRPATLPFRWRWEDLLPAAQRAGELVAVGRGGERRAIAFANPGLSGRPYATSTLWAAMQYLGPGETAPAHRHTPAAIRLVLEGTGVWTTVDGDRCRMERGDLVLTPSWCWHEHTSDSAGPMVWFDGLDLPLVEALDGVFFEPGSVGEVPAAAGDDLSVRRYGAAGIVPGAASLVDAATPATSRLLRYRWADTDRALQANRHVRFVDPGTGRSALPTLGCSMFRLSPGERPTANRRAGSSVVVVMSGRGESHIGGQEFSWGPGDALAVPSWAVVEHRCSEVADLFVLDDEPVMAALGLARCEVV